MSLENQAPKWVIDSVKGSIPSEWNQVKSGWENRSEFFQKENPGFSSIYVYMDDAGYMWKKMIRKRDKVSETWGNVQFASVTLFIVCVAFIFFGVHFTTNSQTLEDLVAGSIMAICVVMIITSIYERDQRAPK